MEKVDLVLSVVEPARAKPDEVLLKANDGAVKEPERLNNVACNGECFFRVEGASRKVDGKWVRDYENADQPYRLTSRGRPDDGSEEREPNNTADRRTPLTLGQADARHRVPEEGRRLLPARSVGPAGEDGACKATLIGILKVDVGLYLHRVRGGREAVAGADVRPAKGDQPETIRYSAEPGVYVFEVRDAKNREANFQDSYQLTVEEGEE